MRRQEVLRKHALRLTRGVNDMDSYDKGKTVMKEEILKLLESSKDYKINIKRNGKATIESLLKQIRKLKPIVIV